MMVFLTVCSSNASTEANVDTSQLIQNEEDKSSTDVLVSEDVADEMIVDIDLTRLSATMVYGQVFDMLVNPEGYNGKTIKMQGIYDVVTDSVTNEEYHYIVVEDATACCSQGIEVRIPEGVSAPELYNVVEVVGTLHTYRGTMMDPNTYFYVETNKIDTI